MTLLNNDPQSIIKSFLLPEEVDTYVIELIYEEFMKAGLILLPSGKTFEANIYPKLDSMFSALKYQTFNTELQDTKSHETKKSIHPGLKLSHLDELIPGQALSDKHYFAKAITGALPNICSQLEEEFYRIDIDKVDAFQTYLRTNNLRVIFAGLGSDEAYAHFAFIGEEFINTETTEVTLSEKMQEAHKVTKAVTIGTDVLAYNSLEKIYVVVKGEAKAKALKVAFEDDTTGLGYVIANHSDKLCIIADQAALELFNT